jgi:hypothetical protein
VHGIRLASSLTRGKEKQCEVESHALLAQARALEHKRRYGGPGGSRGRVWLNTLCFARLRLEAHRDHRDHPNTRSCKETAGHCSRVSENFECSATSERRHAQIDCCGVRKVCVSHQTQVNGFPSFSCDPTQPDLNQHQPQPHQDNIRTRSNSRQCLNELIAIGSRYIW